MSWRFISVTGKHMGPKPQGYRCDVPKHEIRISHWVVNTVSSTTHKLGWEAEINWGLFDLTQDPAFYNFEVSIILMQFQSLHFPFGFSAVLSQPIASLYVYSLTFLLVGNPICSWVSRLTPGNRVNEMVSLNKVKFYIFHEIIIYKEAKTPTHKISWILFRMYNDIFCLFLL